MRSIAALSTIFAVTSSLGGNSLLASNGESFFYSSAYGIPLSSNVVQKVVSTNTHGSSILSSRDMVMADLTFSYDIFSMQHDQNYLSNRPQYVVAYKLRVSLKKDVKYANGLGGWFTETGNTTLEDVTIEFEFDNWGSDGVQNYIYCPVDPLYINKYVYTINPALNTSYVDAIDFDNVNVNNLSGRYVFYYVPYFDDIMVDAYNLKPLDQPLTNYNSIASKDSKVTNKAVVHSYFSHQTFPSNGEDITYYGLFCVVPPGYVSVLNMNLTVSVLTSIARDNFWGECEKYGFIEEKNIQLF